MKIFLAIVLLFTSSFAGAYDLTIGDLQVVTSLNTVINKMIAKSPSKKSSIIAILQAFVTKVQNNPRVSAIIGSVVTALVPSLPLTTGTIMTGTTSTTTGTLQVTNTGTQTSWTVSVSIPGTLIPTSGRCWNGLQLRSLGMFKGLYTSTGGQIFSPIVNSISTIDDNDQCLYITTVYSGISNEITNRVYGTTFNELRGLTENVWSLKRVGGVLGDYFLYNPSVNELRYYGTGRATGVVSGSGVIVIDPGMYYSIQYRGDNKFTVQTSKGEVMDILGNK